MNEATESFRATLVITAENKLDSKFLMLDEALEVLKSGKYHLEVVPPHDASTSDIVLIIHRAPF